MLGKAVQAEVQPMQDVTCFLETFLNDLIQKSERRENEEHYSKSTDTETRSSQPQIASASTAQAGEAAPEAVTRADAAPAAVYTPARTPGRGRLGLSGTPSRVSVLGSATPGTDVFYTPASCFLPSTLSGILGSDSPMLLASPKVFR